MRCILYWIQILSSRFIKIYLVLNEVVRFIEENYSLALYGLYSTVYLRELGTEVVAPLLYQQFTDTQVETESRNL